MGQQTAISWTDHTFNPWWGCTKISPACDHCYAATFAARVGQSVWGADAERRFFGDDHWNMPLKWNRAAMKTGIRRRVFCASMADVFEHRTDLEGERGRLFDLIGATPMLDWQLLTKRPHRIAPEFPSEWLRTPPVNLWIGVTVESPDYLWRLYQLLDVRAAVHFVSYEPALADVTWPLDGRLDWVIAGGESGAQHRPVNAAWIRSTRDQCVQAGVPFHFKQWGGRTPSANGCELDGREWKEFPKMGA
jgi:protein gp37